MKMLCVILILIALPAYPLAVSASGERKAPEWEIAEWINGKGVQVQDLKGKVIVLEFFQLWCPGCNRFSIPLMERWRERFDDEIQAGRLVMVSIHTVFEGHDYQTPERLRGFLKEKGISHLVGIDLHREHELIPETMKKYQTRGTPEMAIIDKRGHIRFQEFGGFDTQKAEALIARLLDERV